MGKDVAYCLFVYMLTGRLLIRHGYKGIWHRCQINNIWKQSVQSGINLYLWIHVCIIYHHPSKLF